MNKTKQFLKNKTIVFNTFDNKIIFLKDFFITVY